MRDNRYPIRLPEGLAPYAGRLQEAIEHYRSLPKPRPRLAVVPGPYGQPGTARLDEWAYAIACQAPPGWCRAVLAWHVSSSQMSTALAPPPERPRQAVSASQVSQGAAGLARREAGPRRRNGRLTRRDLWREYYTLEAMRKIILSGHASMEERAQYAEAEHLYLGHAEIVRRREGRNLPKPDWYDDSRMTPWANLDDHAKLYWWSIAVPTPRS